MKAPYPLHIGMYKAQINCGRVATNTISAARINSPDIVMEGEIRAMTEETTPITQIQSLRAMLSSISVACEV